MKTKLMKYVIGAVLFFGLVSPAKADVHLSLSPSSQEVGLNEQFTLDMVLQNSFQEQVGMLNVFLKFDPDYLQVLDSDTGNWETDGINVLDGPYHGVFNWEEFPAQNVADNTEGTISYGGASFFNEVRGSGTFAQINFLSKAPVSNTRIDYFYSGLYDLEDTYALNLMAVNILSGASGASVSVTPEPLSCLLYVAGGAVFGLFGLRKKTKTI